MQSLQVLESVAAKDDVLGKDVEEKKKVARSLGFSDDALKMLYSIWSEVKERNKERGNNASKKPWILNDKMAGDKNKEFGFSFDRWYVHSIRSIFHFIIKILHYDIFIIFILSYHIFPPYIWWIWVKGICRLNVPTDTIHLFDQEWVELIQIEEVDEQLIIIISRVHEMG